MEALPTRKYVLDIDELPDLEQALVGRSHKVELDVSTWSECRSLYFDTPALDCHTAARSDRRRRFTVRKRDCLQTGESWLEVETQGPQGRTVEDRTLLTNHEVGLAEHVWLAKTLDQRGHDDVLLVSLIPALEAGYRRRTVQVVADPDEAESRITIDVALSCRLPDDAPGARREICFDRLAIIETAGTLRSSCADRTLWSMGHRPTEISKYGLGVAALRPDKPPLKWQYLLTHQMAIA